MAQSAAVTYLFPESDDAAPRSDFETIRSLLNRMRFLAQTCRVKARLDLFQACSAIQACHEGALDAHAEMLVRVVDQAIGRPMVFLAPNAPDLSRDEEWMMRLIEREMAGDASSVEFLSRRHVNPVHRERLRMIIKSVGAVYAASS